MAQVTQVNTAEARTHLSRLVRVIEEGAEVVIARAGRPVARLVPVERPLKRQLGLRKGHITIHENFDDPMPREFLEYFDGTR